MKITTTKAMMLLILLIISSYTKVQATKWIVNVQNFSFSPASLPSVQTGDTIRWVWVSGVHTTTSLEVPIGAAAWDQLINSTNTSYEYIPVVSGTYNYKCTPHFAGGMVGSFIVSDPQFMSVDLKVFLEGPFDIGSMSTTLADLGLVPLEQPYNPALPYFGNNTPVWLHTGNENVASIPAGVVDWIVVEFRDADNAAAASSATTMSRNVYFITAGGSIVDLDGISLPVLSFIPQQGLFSVLFHRNHLAVMNSNPLTDGGGGIATYDFTTDAGKFYGGSSGSTEIVPGIWGMISGDSNGDNLVDQMDKVNAWDLLAGESGYLASDLTLDAESNNIDKNKLWDINFGKFSSIP